MADSQSNHELTAILTERIDTLEARLAFQDDVIDQLNHEVAVHQEQIAEMSHQIKLLAARFKESGTVSMMKPEDEPPPPHY